MAQNVFDTCTLLYVTGKILLLDMREIRDPKILSLIEISNKYILWSSKKINALIKNVLLCSMYGITC